MNEPALAVLVDVEASATSLMIYTVSISSAGHRLQNDEPDQVLHVNGLVNGLVGLTGKTTGGRIC